MERSPGQRNERAHRNLIKTFFTLTETFVSQKNVNLCDNRVKMVLCGNLNGTGRMVGWRESRG